MKQSTIMPLYRSKWNWSIRNRVKWTPFPKVTLIFWQFVQNRGITSRGERWKINLSASWICFVWDWMLYILPLRGKTRNSVWPSLHLRKKKYVAIHDRRGCNSFHILWAVCRCGFVRGSNREFIRINGTQRVAVLLSASPILPLRLAHSR